MKWIMILIMGVIMICSVSSYTPPGSNDIQLVLDKDYTPPFDSNIQLVLGDVGEDVPVGDTCTPIHATDWTILDECIKNQFKFNLENNTLYIGNGGSLRLLQSSNLTVSKINFTHQSNVAILNKSKKSKLNITGK